ncbi:hypothetical protein FJMB80182_41560 [Enterobacter hormaechei]|nr:hypothetical protein FJMB80063_40580 [Enterobacter hormaechei]BDK32432.1 hypothetical protein FJMB80068_39960 [Enterobacter hormaechei]BDK37613.1 hypothetical protein FJMB80144_41240 [Enterobacter hormaechei]BDK42812.1 hypothetical protein FJMB80145_41250 [Enterobacter hormaechei]BDK48024.1 hypothetical protein FJMB80146_41330 [Enterobacter hormaechei]
MDIRTGNANRYVLPDTQRVSDDSGAVYHYPLMVGNHHSGSDVCAQLNISSIFENEVSVYLSSSFFQEVTV